METLLMSLVNLGGGFTLAAVILLLHRDALKAFREEMSVERARNDANLGELFVKFDGLRDAYLDARCKLPDGHHPSMVALPSRP